MSLRFLSGVNVDSNTLVVDAANNKVGIGTASPAGILDIIGDGNGTTSSYSQIHVRNSNSAVGDNVAARITFNGDGGTTVYGFIEQRRDAYDSLAIGTKNSTSGDAGYVGIYTRGTEKIRITGVGNVGIGTTAPAQKLDVRGFVVSDSQSNGSESAFYLGNSAHGLSRENLANDVILYTTAGDVKLSANTASTTHLIVKNNGNVGIGTTSPGFKLTLAAASATDSDILLAGMTGVSNGFTVKRVSSSFVYSMIDGGLGINNANPTQALHVTGNVRVTGAFIDSNNEAGSSGQVLTSTGSGTDWVTPATTTATSLYDLLPAARVAYNWTGQVVNDTWTTIFSKSDNVLTTGTWMVKMYVNDFAVGGGHYQYVYSGIMTWEQGVVNQTGEAAFSEVYLHRMGHAANASVLYLRTAESGAAASNLGYFQIKGNYSNTSNQTIQFQFVKIF